MSWSFSETKALAVKASRGAGLPWGLAEEAGMAAMALQRYGISGITFLARYLAELEDTTYPDTKPRRAQSANHVNSSEPNDNLFEPPPDNERLCPIRLGAYLCDTGRPHSGRIYCVHEPILLAPFIQNILERQAADRATKPSGSCTETAPFHCRLKTPQQSVLIGTEFIVVCDTKSAEPETIESDYCSVHYFTRAETIAESAETSPRRTLHKRVTSSDSQAIADLGRLAAKTYAPATEESRRKGAGAGLSDND